MENKKRIILIIVLIFILSAIFLYQKSLITDFSLKPERVELLFDMNREILPFILLEEQYISEKYDIRYEYEKDNLDNHIYIISIQKTVNIEDEFFKDRFIDYLKIRVPEIDEETLNITDYSDTNRILMEWHKGIKLFIVSLLFILIAIILVRRIKVIIKSVKKELKIYYFKEIIHLRISQILEEAIKLVLLIFSEIFLLQWIIKFQFNIPGRFLPVNDIFDREFYRNINNTTKVNLSSYGDFYNMTLYKVRLLTFGFLILGILTFLLIITMFNSKEPKGGDEIGKSSI
ncbi:hypothetical protein KQI41_14240 [Tissierella pigra]|uniref:Uncharacterized protein n=1 Tax=Tissierella pigra TaxID=2607614 RepID=A0A6N7XS98_9FIRM|nr:hypothetical protein [Tissierella pigra]MBU5427544.1 hypothetical protein [Tissierella pigra]MSU00293.1 hypothetical protein [Tissierella pigra]